MRSEDLRYFLGVIEAGKLGAASDLLGITQPGLTKAIARLETELGGPLFRRTGRGMELTELGVSFEQRAQRITLELDRAMAEARACNPHEGVIRFGIAPQLQHLAVDLCAQFVRQRPLVRFQMFQQISDQLVVGLIGSRIDIALVSESKAFPEDLVFEPLDRIELGIVAGPDHPLAKVTRPLQLADLVGHDWALPSTDTLVRRHLVQAFRARGLPEPVTRIENDVSSSVVPLAVQCGLLSICTPYTLDEVAAGTVVRLPVEDFSWWRRVGLLMQRGFPLNAVAADFAQQLLLRRRDAMKASPSPGTAA